MKPIVSALNAWTCIVISIAAIIILSVIGGMYRNGSHTLMGSEEDPADGKQVAGAIFSAVIVYVVFLIFCGTQVVWHMREGRKGAITLR